MCADPLKPKIKPSPSAAVVTFLLPKVGAEKCWGGEGTCQNWGKRDCGRALISVPLGLTSSSESLPVESH